MSKQNTTRDIEIERRLTVTREREEVIMGGKGEWFTGTIIKGIWIITITRRGMETGEGGGKDWGGGQGWGEKAEKCT